MEKPIGFDTPARKWEVLSKDIEQLKKLEPTVGDAMTVACLALGTAYIDFAAEEPHNAREFKDQLLEAADKWGITPSMKDWLSGLLTSICSEAEIRYLK